MVKEEDVIIKLMKRKVFFRFDKIKVILLFKNLAFKFYYK